MMRSYDPRAHGARHSAAAAAALFSLLLSVYLLCYSGTFSADDEQHLAAAAQTLALTGRLDALPVLGNPRLQGHYYDVDPALPAIGALVYKLAAGTPFGAVQALYFINPIVTALTAVVIFHIGLGWGYSPGLSAAAALLYGLGSMAWPYAGTFFRDPLAALGAALGWLGMERALAAGGWRGRLAWGAAALGGLALGSLAKNIIIPLAPLLALSAGLRGGRGRAGWALGGGLMAAAGLLLLRPETPYLFRSSAAYWPWLARWLTAIPHDGFLTALAGALLSPGKGLLVFAPFCCLAALSALLNGRATLGRWLPAWAWLLTLAGAQAFFYDSHWTNPQWGPRFLLPGLPMLAAACLPALDWLWARSGRLAGAAWGLALAAGLATQLPGVLIAPPAYSAIVLALDPRAYFGRAIWDPGYSAVAGHWRLLLGGAAWAPALARNLTVQPAGVLALGLAWALGLAAALGLLRRALNGIGPGGLPAGLLASALVLAGPPAALAVFRGDPAYGGDRPDLLAAVAALNARAGPEATVAVRGYLDPLWYCYFNFGRPGRPWAGLPLYSGPANDAPPGDPFHLPALDAQAADAAFFSGRGPYWLAVDAGSPVGTEGFDLETWLRARYRARLALDGPVRVWQLGGP
jgi:hypothetical protein